MSARNWLLPEYVEDMLPAEARRVESLRRRLLDLFFVHGYELVIPPMLEYMESLLTGTGHDLDLRTIKLVDQLSGRTIGLRADMTPQVARIDAHLLNREGVTRLCYCGSVLHALPSGLNRTREPLQIGAELYGHTGVESDLEIQRLMLAGLAAAGVRDLHLDLGHVGLFRALVQRAGVGAELEADLFQALQMKDLPALRELAAPLAASSRAAILLLPTLYGGPEVLAAAATHLPDEPGITACLGQLRALVAGLDSDVGEVLVDLAELRGYHYHSGIVFAAYVAGSPNAVAQGGRYDEVGKAFGRARPATGFSMDLRELAALVGVDSARAAILAPYAQDPALAAAIARLRGAGEIVVVELPGQGGQAGHTAVDRRLVLAGGVWQVAPLHPQ